MIEAVSLDFDTDQDLDAKKYTADFLLSAPLNAEEAAEIEVAKEFLTETLGSAGERVPTVQVQKAAAALGIAKRTLERARKALKVHPEKSKVDGTWSMWISPKDHPVNQARRRQG